MFIHNSEATATISSQNRKPQQPRFPHCAYFSQIYSVNRQWKPLQLPEEKTQERLLAVFCHYEVAISCAGRGWNEPSLLAFGVLASTEKYEGPRLERLNRLCSEHRDYVFGHAGYGLRSETESIRNGHANEDGFSDLFFFVPKIVLRRHNEEWLAGWLNENDLAEFEQLLHAPPVQHEHVSNALRATTDWSVYRQQCESLLRHIHRGDIYEINYCIDFTAKNAIDPVQVFQRLNALADAPMSAFYRNGNSWLMCASPERFIARTGNTLISQPIKGTIRRGKDEAEDEQLRRTLFNDPKERSENVMIVDLVRNDLSRIAERGSVHVPELFGIHTFKTVHQMISTVQCTVKPTITPGEILRATFPMGSMTGAPKISAMNLAETHESQSRGIYSGSVGYILPNGDFDFNVVIRSVTWNAATQHVSAKAGSAITANSVPEKEYEECLLKAKAMMSALE